MRMIIIHLNNNKEGIKTFVKNIFNYINVNHNFIEEAL